MFFRNKIEPIKRGFYAVNTGIYAGEFFVYVEKTNNTFNFLSLPKMLFRSVPTESFSVGLKNKIISFIKSLPTDVYELCVKEYQFSKKNKAPRTVRYKNKVETVNKKNK